MTNGSVIFDRETYGRLVRAARIIAGFDRVEDAAVAIRDTVGFEVSTRSLYAIERGEQEPSIHQYIAIAMTFRPPGGPAYWDTALREDVRDYFRGR